MKLQLFTTAESSNSTLSSLRTDDGAPINFVCHVLEDGKRDVKVHGETRIPAGSYEVVRRYEGRHFDMYSKKFGHKHTFMLKDVPNFKYIMIHIGNTVKDTEGCLLVGLGTRYIGATNTFELTESTVAYQRLYNLLTNAFLRGEQVWINVYRN